MIQTKIFKSNQSQAVKLPKAVSFPEGVKEVEIIVIGDSRVITPKNISWDSWFDTPLDEVISSLKYRGKRKTLDDREQAIKKGAMEHLSDCCWY